MYGLSDIGYPPMKEWNYLSLPMKSTSKRTKTLMLDSETINREGRKNTLWYQQKYKLSEKSSCSEINVNIIVTEETIKRCSLQNGKFSLAIYLIELIARTYKELNAIGLEQSIQQTG